MVVVGPALLGSEQCSVKLSNTWVPYWGPSITAPLSLFTLSLCLRTFNVLAFSFVGLEMTLEFLWHLILKMILSVELRSSAGFSSSWKLIHSFVTRHSSFLMLGQRVHVHSLFSFWDYQYNNSGAFYVEVLNDLAFQAISKWLCTDSCLDLEQSQPWFHLSICADLLACFGF